MKLSSLAQGANILLWELMYILFLSTLMVQLAQDEIIKIALAHGVSMIHPGYGFLSENATFAKKVEDAGLIFIGPRPDVIDSLGDKTKARTIGMRSLN